MSESPSGLLLLRRITWCTTILALAAVVTLIAVEPIGPLPLRLAVVTAAAVACLVAGTVMLSSAGRAPRWSAALAVVAAAAVVAAGRAGSDGGFPWVLPASAVVGAWLVSGPAALVPVLAVAVAGASLAGRSWTGVVTDLALTAVCAAGLAAQAWIQRTADRLAAAARSARVAAVTEERLRFAADLHDIQGHRLQVIALKSELAERLAATDPDRAAAEMREVGALARAALTETREVVQGYRPVRLATEIANAVRVLGAAGIDATASGVAAGLPAEVENLLALVVREGTTNVLRHSTARHGEITLGTGPGEVRLRFANDGADERTGPPGGLAVLAGRLTGAGGTLTAGGDAGWFAVDVRVPLAPR